MLKWLTLSLIVMLICCAVQLPAAEGVEKPEIVITAENFAPDGKPRQFPGPGGLISWSPMSPVYRGDRLLVSYSMTGDAPIMEVEVRLDDKPLTRLTSPPWEVAVETAGLPAGRHVLRGEVRAKTEPITYGFAKLEFYVQEPPQVQVKGTAEELPARGSADVAARNQPRVIDPSIVVMLHSTDPAVDRAIAGRERITLDRPALFYLQANVERWAYSISRGDREVISGGPMVRRLYLELAPQTAAREGLLPGELKLTVWGVRNDGAYSEPVIVLLLVM